MGLTEIEKILESEAGLKVCKICGSPYKPYHSRQKTCGKPECKKASQRESVKRRNEERKAEDPDKYRASRSEAMRKYRQKKKALKVRETQLKELSKQWEKQLEFDKKIAEYGFEYGKRSAEKVLATVPKIDVNIFKKGENDEQSVL